MAKEKKIFAGGGMDMDTEERLIKSNDYRYALNCRIASSDEENEGTVENIRGNQILNSGLTTSDGTLLEEMQFTIIGHYEDKTLDIFYYFVHHTGGKHCIVSNFAWDADFGGRPGGFQVLYEDIGLNFHEDYLITGVNMIHSDEFAKGGMLYWTDDRNPPRKLNTLRSYWWTHTSTLTDPALTYLEAPNLNAISKPPITNPYLVLGTDKGVSSTENELQGVNYIKDKGWQFKYRYIYRDLQKSSWSPISESIATQRGHLPDSTDNENSIQLSVFCGEKDVIEIEIACRDVSVKEDFYSVKIIKKNNTIQKNVFLNKFIFTTPINVPAAFDVISETITNNSLLHYMFYGDETKLPIDISESNKLFDDVPQLAKAQEIVDGNRLVYGNVVNGYDAVDTDVDFQLCYSDIDAPSINNIPLSVTLSHWNDYCWDNSGNFDPSPETSLYSRFRLEIDLPDFTTINPGDQWFLNIEDMMCMAYFYRDTNVVPGCGGSSNDKYVQEAWRVNITTTALTLSPTTNINTILTHLESAATTVTISSIDSHVENSHMKLNAGFTSMGNDCASPNGNDVTNNFSSGFSYNSNDNAFWTISGGKIRFEQQVYSPDFESACGPRDHDELFVSSSAQYNSVVNSASNKTFGKLDDITQQYTFNYTNVIIPFTLATNDYLKSFKSGISHGFGIVYYDEFNRSGAVNPCGSVHVPTPQNRNFAVPPFINSKSAAHIQFNIKHEPPDWATHYQMVHSGTNEIEDFVQISVKSINVDLNIETQYRTVLPESQDYDTTSNTYSGFQSVMDSGTAGVFGAVVMDMEELIRYSGKSEQAGIAWTWAKGDRVRFIDTFSFAWDFEIIGIQEDISTTPGRLLYVLSREAFNAQTLFSPVLPQLDVHVEIYRPRKDIKDDIYYEFGHVNQIIAGEHQVNSFLGDGALDEDDISYYDTTGTLIATPAQNQITSVQDAIGYLSNGDVYSRVKQMITNSAVSLLCESFSFSDYFNSRFYDKGRVNAYLPDFKQTRRNTTIFYSEPYMPDTAINGLGTFYPDVSFQEYDKRFNSIQKLHSINDSLIILQEDKISKAMVSRAVLFDATGKQNVAISNNVLSSSVPYAGDFGISLNPESFANFGFRSYFVDARRRVVLRLSQDGLTVISEHKMKNFFTDYFQEVIDRRKTRLLKIYGAYDNKFDEYVVSVANTAWQTTDPNGTVIRNTIPGFTIGFNEPSKRWNSFYSFINYIAVYNETLHSFKGASIYKHNSLQDLNGDPVYNIFYDIEQDSVLEFPFNGNPDTTKIYHNISEHSNNIWSIDALHTRNSQMTDISFEEFTNNAAFSWEEGHGTKENIHNAVIRCNVLTPGVTNPKIEGDRMRDTSIMCRLLLDSPRAQGQTVLFSVTVNFIPSSGPDLIG